MGTACIWSSARPALGGGFSAPSSQATQTGRFVPRVREGHEPRRAEADVAAFTLARAGGNPLAERRRAKRTVPTLREAAKTVHASHAAAFRNVKHKAQWLASLTADVFPVFGDRPVNAIESGDVLKALAPIWTTKPETARRLKQRIRVVLDWAKASAFRSGDNPVDGVTQVLPRMRQSPVHHAALPYAQVPAFLVAMRETNAADVTKIALEFLILTATRTSEVLGARWSEIDRRPRRPCSRARATTSSSPTSGVSWTPAGRPRRRARSCSPAPAGGSSPAGLDPRRAPGPAPLRQRPRPPPHAWKGPPAMIVASSPEAPRLFTDLHDRIGTQRQLADVVAGTLA